VAVPQGTYDQLAEYLIRTGYSLNIDISDEQLDEFTDRYFELTGEDLVVTPRSKDSRHAQKGGWKLEFHDTPEVKSIIPFPIEVAGEVGHPSRTPQSLTDGEVLRLDYNEPVWELIERGLRLTSGKKIGFRYNRWEYAI
jgi:hypothetical protein